MWKPGRRSRVAGSGGVPERMGTIIQRHDVNGEPGYIVLLDCGLRDLVHEELLQSPCPQPRVENPSNAAVLSYLAEREIQWKGFGGYRDGENKLGRSTAAARDSLGFTQPQFNSAKDELRRGAVAPLVKTKAKAKTKPKKAASTKTKPKKSAKPVKSKKQKEEEAQTKSKAAALDVVNEAIEAQLPTQAVIAAAVAGDAVAENQKIPLDQREAVTEAVTEAVAGAVAQAPATVATEAGISSTDAEMLAAMSAMFQQTLSQVQVG